MNLPAVLLLVGAMAIVGNAIERQPGSSYPNRPVRMIVINRVNPEVTRILRLPEVRDRILVTGNEPAPTTPEEFGNFIKSEVAK